jgi:hypothetical protein
LLNIQCPYGGVLERDGSMQNSRSNRESGTEENVTASNLLPHADLLCMHVATGKDVWYFG